MGPSDRAATFRRQTMTRCFAADTWLAETLARPVFKWTGCTEGVAEGRLAAEMVELANGGDAFFFARMPTTDVSQCAAFSRAGFSVVDTGITFAWAGEVEAPQSDISVGVVRPEQHAAVTEIAGRCFRWSRFHLDPRIPVGLANLVKRRWIESYCRGHRGTVLYVGSVDDRVAGFLAVLESSMENRPYAAIDLIGVSPEYQGRGVGTALVRRFVEDWRERAKELRVGTQAANVQSLRFYERNGFRAVGSSYVLHAHYYGGGIGT